MTRKRPTLPSSNLRAVSAGCGSSLVSAQPTPYLREASGDCKLGALHKGRGERCDGSASEIGTLGGAHALGARA